MPTRKSAEDIRRQTSRICKSALESLSRGAITRKEFARRIARVTNVEKRYTENIKQQPQYIAQVRKSYKDAESILYPQSTYMYESVVG